MKNLDLVDEYSSGITAEDQHKSHLERRKRQADKAISNITLLVDHTEPKIKYEPLPPTKFQKILRYVCNKQQVSHKDVLSHKKQRYLVNARREIAFICVVSREMSLSYVGKYMKRDHSTIFRLVDGWKRFIKIYEGKGRYNYLIGPYEKTLNWQWIEEYTNENS